MNAVAGGWNLNVIYQFTSAPPIGFGNVIYTPTSTAFGQVTATIWTEQKKVTVGAKLIW